MRGGVHEKHFISFLLVGILDEFDLFCTFPSFFLSFSLTSASVFSYILYHLFSPSPPIPYSFSCRMKETDQACCPGGEAFIFSGPNASWRVALLAPEYIKGVLSEVPSVANMHDGESFSNQCMQGDLGEQWKDCVISQYKCIETVYFFTRKDSISF